MLSQILMVIALAVLAYMVWITMNGNELFTGKKMCSVDSTETKSSNNLTTAPMTKPITTAPMTKPITTAPRPIATAPRNEGMMNYSMNKPMTQPRNEGMMNHSMTKPINEGMANHLPQYPSQNNNNAVRFRESMPPASKEILKQQYEGFANGVEDINNANMIIKETIVSPTMPSVNIPQAKDASGYRAMSANSPANTTSNNEIDYATVPSTFKGSQPSGETNDDINDVYKVDGTDLLAAPLADRFYYTNSIANVNRNASNDLRGDIAISYNDSYTPFYQSSIYGEPLTVNRLGDSK